MDGDEEKKTKETRPDWLVKLAEVREKTDDPVVDAMARIGGFVDDSIKSVDKRLDAASERDDEIKRSVDKVKTSLETQMDAGFRMAAEKMEALTKRQIIEGGASASPFSVGDRLLAAIPNENKKLIREAEFYVANEKRAGRKTPLTGDAVGATLAALWFATSAKLQCTRNFAGQQSKLAEQLEKYEKAIEDIYGEDEIRAKAAYAEGAAGTGGNLVPTIIAADVLRIIKDSSVVASRARHVPMTSNDMRIPNEDTGITVYWADEGSTLTQGEGTFGQNILTAKKITGRAAANIEVVQDSVIGLLPYVQAVMAEQIGWELDQEALEGDGTNFTGLNAEASVNSVATTTTDGENVVYVDLVKAVYAADESSVTDGAQWFMHRKIFATIVGMVDSNGRPIFQPAVDVGSPGSILGFPLSTTSSIATNTTRGATGNTSNIYFGNPLKLIFGDRQTLVWDVTDTGPNWDKYMVDMRMVGRFGFTVATPAAFSKIVGCTQL